MKVCCVIKYLLNINKEQKYDEPMGTVKNKERKTAVKTKKDSQRSTNHHTYNENQIFSKNNPIETD